MGLNQARAVKTFHKVHYVTYYVTPTFRWSHIGDPSTTIPIIPLTQLNMSNPAISHQLAIARASLSAALLRADPTPVTRDEITRFHTLLDTALTQCTPRNIQLCKRWILQYMSTRPRFASLGKFLATLSGTLPRRKRLHIVYLFNDVLHHTKFHSPNAEFAPAVTGVLGEIFSAAATPGRQGGKLRKVLDIWRTKGYFPASFINELSIAMTSSPPPPPPLASSARPAQEKPLLLPPFHGDPSLPFYDLPAANFLPHMTPNAPRAINPRLVKPIQFLAATPSEALVSAVKRFIDETADGGDWDWDAAGGEAYFGWSRGFCERMKRRRREARVGV